MLPLASLNTLFSPVRQSSASSLQSTGSRASADSQNALYSSVSPGMASFMQGINNSLASAFQAPGGSTDILTWANGLAEQAKLKQQQAAQQQQTATATGSTATSTSGGNLMQLFQSLLSMLMSQLASK